MEANLLTQLVHAPTRVTNTSRTTIDHILVNNMDYYIFVNTVDPGLSNHYMVITTRKRLGCLTTSIRHSQSRGPAIVACACLFTIVTTDSASGLSPMTLED